MFLWASDSDEPHEKGRESTDERGFHLNRGAASRGRRSVMHAQRLLALLAALRCGKERRFATHTGKHDAGTHDYTDIKE